SLPKRFFKLTDRNNQPPPNPLYLPISLSFKLVPIFYFHILTFKIHLKTIRMKLFTLFITLLLAIPAFAQHEIFIEVAGIPGESTDATHKNWIDAYAYSGGLSNSGS